MADFVVIKGMEMPKNCLHCHCTDTEYGECVLDPEKRCPDDYKKRADWCPLVPAADVRPVVLCRDCVYSYDSVGGWCCSHGICVDCIVREDFFCADGEKREES